MRLVRSSEPGAVERDLAIRLLTDRAVLTRMVCTEVRDGGIEVTDRRSQHALFLLLRWIAENQGEYVKVEPAADDGLNSMVVPAGYEDLVGEIRSGARVCNALFLLMTCDNGLQVQQSHASVQKALETYWAQYPTPISVRR